MAALDTEQVRALENIRTRLLTLRSSLAKLQENIATSQPLPSAASFQTSATVVANSIQSIAEQLAEHQHLLTSIAVFPLPQFPGRYQGHILTDTLLRTKLEPHVEEWLEEGQKIPDQTQDTATTERGYNSDRLSEYDCEQLWKWAPGAANREARKQKWGADYTLAEVRAGVDNLVTGLKRELVEPDDDDDEDDYMDGEEDDYEEVTDDEGGGGDKADVQRSSTGSAGDASAGAGTTTENTAQQAGAQPAVAGRPAYLETLQEYLTVGKVVKYFPKAIEERSEAEKKKQRMVPI